MTLSESLDYLACELAGITLEKDPYAFRVAYPSNKARILKYWSEVKPRLKRDADRIAPIEALMDEMFYAFESGDKGKGTLIALALWGGRQIKKLR